MTHVLLTGANSFIGPHVLKHLIAAGHNVTAVGRRPPINTSNTSNYITIDLNQRKGFDQLPKDVNAIIHLAAQLPTPSTTVSQLVANNILATRNTISYAIKSGVTRFIYASTRSVYGQVSTAIVDELTPIIDPSTYGLTKYACRITTGGRKQHFTVPSYSTSRSAWTKSQTSLDSRCTRVNVGWAHCYHLQS